MTTTTTLIRPETSLADLATQLPGAIRVFHRHHLDFCCGGHVSLGSACSERKLDVVAVTAELRDESARSSEPLPADTLALPELVAHILERFHAKHREDLPQLVAMARKVEKVHAERVDCPRGLAAFLAFLSDELESHMQKEEQVLFPMILSGRGRMAAMPVQVMELEHKEHGANLERLRKLTNDHTAPSDACATWTGLYLGLAELERELMQHIHLENNVLFPRALRA